MNFKLPWSKQSTLVDILWDAHKNLDIAEKNLPDDGYTVTNTRCIKSAKGMIVNLITRLHSQ